MKSEMIEPLFWSGRGLYSKTAIRRASIDRSPIVKVEQEKGNGTAPNGKNKIAVPEPQEKGEKE